MTKIIPLFLLLAGIFVGVYLVLEGPKIFKPKATSESVEFLEGDCLKVKDGKKVLTCLGPVKFKIISPLDLNSTSFKINFVKTAYAQQNLGGKGYYCKEQTPYKIYHKKCNLPINICNLPLFDQFLEEKEDDCDLSEECGPADNEVGARCISVKTFQPGIEPKITPITRDFVPTSDLTERLPEEVFSDEFVTEEPIFEPEVEPEPEPEPESESDFESEVEPSLEVTEEPSDEPEESQAENNEDNNSGVGTTDPPEPQTQRTTLKYRFAENASDVEKAEWSDYTAGGVTITYTFTETALGPKFIFVQFQDDLGQIFNADPYPAQIELVATEPENQAGGVLQIECTVDKTSTVVGEKAVYEGKVLSGGLDKQEYKYIWGGDVKEEETRTRKVDIIGAEFKSPGKKSVSLLVSQGDLTSETAACPTVVVTGDSEDNSSDE